MPLLHHLQRLRHHLIQPLRLGLQRLMALRSFGAGKALLTALALLLLTLILGPSLAAWWLFGVGEDHLGRYTEIHQRRITPIVLDHQGQLIGLWPWNADGSHTPQPYLGAAVTTLPPHWWTMVVLLEDANRHRWYHIGGIDWSQFPKMAARFLLGRPNSGASTLEMQLIKTLNADTDVGGLLRLKRKLRDLLHAPAVARALDEAQLAHWAAAHFPLTDSGPHGLEAASWLLFNRPAAQLDLAHQAILAAAVKRRIRTRPRDQAGWEAAQRRWQGTLRRAHLALERLAQAGHIDSKQLQRAHLALERIPQPDLRPGPTLSHCLEHRERDDIDLAARKLDIRAKFIAQGELRQVNAELSPLLGRDWPRHASRIRLTIDRDTNCNAKWQIHRRHRAWTQRLGLPQEKTYLVVAVADHTGRLIRFYATSAYPQYLAFRLQGGRFQRTAPHGDQRRIGSIGKVFAALLAGRAGDRADTPYYRLRRARLIGRYPYQQRSWYRNADGFTGHADANEPGAAIPARLAFARSDNLAVMERLARIPHLARQADTLLDAFGFFPGDLHAPIPDLALGNLHGSPRLVHGLFAPLAAPEAGLTPDCRPSLLEHLEGHPQQQRRLHQRLTEARHQRLQQCRKARHWLQNNPGLDFVHQVLGAVLDPQAHGSASRHLAALRPGGPHRPRLSIAKTGTVTADPERRTTRWVWLGGAFITADGRRYSYLAHAGPLGTTPDLGHASGGQLGQILAPILEPLISPRTTSTTDHP